MGAAGQGEGLVMIQVNVIIGDISQLVGTKQ